MWTTNTSLPKVSYIKSIDVYLVFCFFMTFLSVVQFGVVSYEHHIELNVSIDAINMYRETYYKMTTFDVSLKSMASYKVEELLDLCKKLDIVLDQSFKEEKEEKEEKKGKKKLGKKDIYELLVQHF